MDTIDTLGALFTMALGIVVTLGGAHGLRNLRQDCDTALHAGCRTEPSWRIKVWVWALYTVGSAGVLVVGTLMFGLTLVDLIF